MPFYASKWKLKFNFQATKNLIRKACTNVDAQSKFCISTFLHPQDKKVQASKLIEPSEWGNGFAEEILFQALCLFSYLGRSQHWSPYKGIGVPWCDFISRCCKIVFMIMNRRNCTLCEFYLFHVECRTKLLKLSGKLSTTVHTNHHSEIEETGAKGQIGQSFREVSRTWAISFHDLHHQQFARGIRLEK